MPVSEEESIRCSNCGLTRKWALFKKHGSRDELYGRAFVRCYSCKKPIVEIPKELKQSLDEVDASRYKQDPAYIKLAIVFWFAFLLLNAISYALLALRGSVQIIAPRGGAGAFIVYIIVVHWLIKDRSETARWVFLVLALFNSIYGVASILVSSTTTLVELMLALLMYGSIYTSVLVLMTGHSRRLRKVLGTVFFIIALVPSLAIFLVR